MNTSDDVWSDPKAVTPGASRCGDSAARERLLLAIGDIAELVIARTVGAESFHVVLRLAGEVVGATRVSYFDLREDGAGHRRVFPTHEWASETLSAIQMNPFESVGTSKSWERWLVAFAAGEIVSGRMLEFPPQERGFIDSLGVRSMALVPVARQHGLCGFLAFQDHRTDLDWPSVVQDALSRVARLLGRGLDRCSQCLRQQAIEAGFHALLDNLNEAVFKTDERGNFTYLNGAWHELMGEAPSEAIGRFCGSFAVAEDRRSARRELLALLHGQLEAHRCEVRLQRSDGTAVWVQVSARQLKGPDGNRHGLAGTIMDISARRQAEQEMRVAKQEAETANRAKSDFLSTMSHELRTPLNAVIGLSESLLETAPNADPARTHRFLDLIHSAGQQLFQQINDILDLARIDSGRLKLNVGPVEAGSLCALGFESVRKEAEAKGLRLELERPDVPLVLQADERLIGQAVQNLLRNAVKFTPNGGRVVLAAKAQADGGVCIAVSDTGIGIAPEKQHLLFKPFTQIDSSISRRFGGTGLGLVLVDKYVRLHGGSVSVESKPVFGSTFSIFLPLQPPASAIVSVA